MSTLQRACLWVALLSVVVSAQSPDATRLQGTWQLDKTQGTLPGGIRTTDQRLTITTSGDTVHVKRCCFIGPIISTQNAYVLDGRSHEYTRDTDEVPQTTSVRTDRWLSDVEGFEVVEGNVTQRWVLSADGRSLSIETSVHRPCPPCFPENPAVDHNIAVFLKVP
jgi:hypothetical protein